MKANRRALWGNAAMKALGFVVAAFPTPQLVQREGDWYHDIEARSLSSSISLGLLSVSPTQLRAVDVVQEQFILASAMRCRRSRPAHRA